MKRQVLHVLRISTGVTLVVLGIAGLVLPFLQGWAMIIAGALLLGFDRARMSGCVRRLEQRWPKLRWLLRPLRRILHFEWRKKRTAPSG